MLNFRIEDMTCGRCAGTIAKAIAQVDPDARVEVNIGAKIVSVSGTASETDLSEAICDAGYTPQRVAGAIVQAPAARSGCCCSSKQAA